LQGAVRVCQPAQRCVTYIHVTHVLLVPGNTHLQCNSFPCQKLASQFIDLMEAAAHMALPMSVDLEHELHQWH
jgi:hypothetical protein